MISRGLFHALQFCETAKLSAGAGATQMTHDKVYCRHSKNDRYITILLVMVLCTCLYILEEDRCWFTFHIYELESQRTPKLLGKRIWIPGMLCTHWKSSKVEGYCLPFLFMEIAERETLWTWTGTLSYWETSKRQGKKLLSSKIIVNLIIVIILLMSFL